MISIERKKGKFRDVELFFFPKTLHYLIIQYAKINDVMSTDKRKLYKTEKKVREIFNNL